MIKKISLQEIVDESVERIQVAGINVGRKQLYYCAEQEIIFVELLNGCKTYRVSTQDLTFLFLNTEENLFVFRKNRNPQENHIYDIQTKSFTQVLLSENVVDVCRPLADPRQLLFLTAKNRLLKVNLLTNQAATFYPAAQLKHVINFSKEFLFGISSSALHVLDQRGLETRAEHRFDGVVRYAFCKNNAVVVLHSNHRSENFLEVVSHVNAGWHKSLHRRLDDGPAVSLYSDLVLFSDLGEKFAKEVIMVIAQKGDGSTDLILYDVNS